MKKRISTILIIVTLNIFFMTQLGDINAKASENEKVPQPLDVSSEK